LVLCRGKCAPTATPVKAANFEPDQVPETHFVKAADHLASGYSPVERSHIWPNRDVVGDDANHTPILRHALTAARLAECSLFDRAHRLLPLPQRSDP